MTSIKDIAKKAGVAVSTVSYALNNHPKISKETIEKIKKVAEELNYVPNVHAKKLKKKKTGRIGLFVYSILGDYFGDLLRGIEEGLEENEYELLISTFHDDKKINSYNLMMEGWVDGAIIHNASLWSDDLIMKLAKKMPLVLFDANPADNLDNISTIVLDNYNGIYSLTEHLIKQGYTKIGFLEGKKQSWDNQRRFEAYEQAMTNNGLSVDESYIIEGNFNEKDSYKNTIKLIEGGNLPEAVVSANDQMAIGAIQAFREKGVDVPGDIAITGFDNVQLSSIIYPSLTTVTYDRYQMGRTSVDMLFDMLLKKTNLSHLAKIDAEVIIRASSSR